MNRVRVSRTTEVTAAPPVDVVQLRWKHMELRCDGDKVKRDGVG